MIKNALTRFTSVASPMINSIATMASTAVNSKGGFAAIVQVTCTSDKVSNFNRIKTLIEQAVSNHNASVVFLPEAFDFIGESTNETLQLAEPIDGPLITQYRDLAQALKVSLSLGGFHEAITDNEGTVSKIKNTHLMINEDGSIIAKYSKCHLFDVEIPEKNLKLKESDYVIPGAEICRPVSTSIGHVGLGICYDLRFPELSIALGRNNSIGHEADILTYPSAFTIPTGSAHWEVLLRARAIENQCYVVAAAQTGVHNKKRSSYGHSMIVDPWGSIVAQCSEGEGVSSAYINLDYLQKLRRNMPVWSHRRNDMYSLVLENEVQIPKLQTDELEHNSAILKDQLFGSFSIPKEQIILVSRHSFVTVNIKPVVPLHLLVIPKRVNFNYITKNFQYNVKKAVCDTYVMIPIRFVFRTFKNCAICLVMKLQIYSILLDKLKN